MLCGQYDAAAAAAVKKALDAELRRNEERRLNGSKVFFDIEINDQPAGRIVMSLFHADAPRAAENFRQLATGEKGIVPEGREGAGKPYHFKGAVFYRIIDKFIDQTGAGAARREEGLGGRGGGQAEIECGLVVWFRKTVMHTLSAVSPPPILPGTESVYGGQFKDDKG